MHQKPISRTLTRQRKPIREIDSPWMNAKQGADYAGDGYRSFLKKLDDGRIRSVRDGRLRKTRRDWIDAFLLSLEGNNGVEKS